MSRIAIQISTGDARLIGVPLKSLGVLNLALSRINLARPYFKQKQKKGRMNSQPQSVMHEWSHLVIRQWYLATIVRMFRKKSNTILQF